jgi:hypothetical protein
MKLLHFAQMFLKVNEARYGFVIRTKLTKLSNEKLTSLNNTDTIG